MASMINLYNYFLIIMCTVRNFTTLSPHFASVTARLMIMTFSFTSWGPHEAVNKLHESTYMIKYEEAIKYVSSIFILRQKMPRRHLLPGGMCVLLQRNFEGFCNDYIIAYQLVWGNLQLPRSFLHVFGSL